MLAAVCHGVDDLRVERRDRPVPGPGEVLLRVEWGGICGSDIAYVRHGASGTAVLRHPLVLGHEYAGTVASVGEGVPPDTVGVRAAVHPATVVGDHCLPERIAGRSNLYPSVRYHGSAALDPHTDGGFCEYKVVRLDQLRTLPDGVDMRTGALVEPLAVALHAVHRAGPLRGRDVLVNGCGPIGCLVVAVLRHLGAGRIWGADVSDAALAIAGALGASDVVNVTRDPLPDDVPLVLEASGVAATLGPVLASVARGGTVIQVGNLSASPVTAVLGNLVTREIDWLGSFRFVDEMDGAIRLLADGLDITPVMTHVFDLAEAAEAVAVAADRSTGSCKVLLRIAGE